MTQYLKLIVIINNSNNSEIMRIGTYIILHITDDLLHNQTKCTQNPVIST